MPHVYINEYDNTVAGRVEENTNVVYIPGLLGDKAEMKIGDIELFKNTKEFGRAVGTFTENNYNSIMAKKLLELGLCILFEAIGEEGDFQEEEELASGEAPHFDFDAVAALVDWDKLTDKGLYRVKFLTTGCASSLDYATDMLKAAKKRGDCIALIDHEAEYKLNSGEVMAEKIHSEYETIATDGNAKFGAAFSPWCKCTLSSKKGEDPLLLPASFVFLAAYGYGTQKNPNWFAYAGSMRGMPPFKIEPIYKYGDEACAILQARDFDEEGNFTDEDNIGFAVNPISNIDPFGNIVWGNRTLMYNTEGLKASSFLNIRNLVCDIKKNLYRSSRKFTFEQNDDILWANFSSEVSPLLDRALSGSGVRGYRLIQQETDIKGRLKALVKIIPIEPAEDFDLTVEMTDTLESVTESD